ATSQHRHRPHVSRQPKIHRQLRSPPAQSNPAAAVAIVMHHRRLAHHLLCHPKSRRTKRPQTHHRPNLPFLPHPHPGQMGSRLRQIHRQSARRNRRAHRPLHTPQQSASSSQRHRGHIRISQKHPSIHNPH